FQAEDGIRDKLVTGVQTCALPILTRSRAMSCANSSGEPPNGSNPCARSLAPTPSDASAALAATASLSTSGRGVPAGATRPNQTRSEERRVGKEGRERWGRWA